MSSLSGDIAKTKRNLHAIVNQYGFELAVTAYFSQHSHLPSDLDIGDWIDCYENQHFDHDIRVLIENLLAENLLPENDHLTSAQCCSLLERGQKTGRNILEVPLRNSLLRTMRKFTVFSDCIQLEKELRFLPEDDSLLVTLCEQMRKLASCSFDYVALFSFAHRIGTHRIATEVINLIFDDVEIIE
ncbi:MAG: hypothetical protein NTW50_03055 [Candidatus Berkelbacteria bacterium]|nr:hypothetical protein [Candidatus Berkelbacteria bacterium]